MLNLIALLVSMTVVFASTPPSSAPIIATKDATSITHLPDALQRDITTWRDRLTAAKCLKVVSETDETWTNLYDLDAKGVPKVIHHERFVVHSWMTPDSIWTVLFPYDGDHADVSHPVLQLYWNATTKVARERAWSGEKSSYQVRRFENNEPFGPASFDFNSRGCIYASAAQSWLVGPPELSGRTISVQSIALMREPNLAIVPPDATQEGVWLDVFSDTWQRNEETTPNKLYRRHDFMLLARNDVSQPEVREWRTIVLTDSSAGGRRPQQITGVRRFAFTFFDSAPAELKSATESFAADVDRAVGK